MTAIAAGGPGFVAAGTVRARRDGCADNRDGRIWTSADGEAWSEAVVPDLPGSEMTAIVDLGGTLFAVAQLGYWSCDGSEVVAILRSSDGLTWKRLQHSGLGRDWLLDATATGGILMAVGYGPNDSSDTRVWTSVDGMTWDQSNDPPRSELILLANVDAVAGVVVTYDEWSAKPFWHSADQGRTWRDEFGPLYRLWSLNSAVGHDRIVAVGEACCALPGQRAGYTMMSTDGVTWELPAAGFRSVPLALAVVPAGFFAVGRETWFSVDGSDWRVGPGIPELSGDWPTVAAADSSRVVVVDPGGSWVAATDGLSPELWTEAPRPAEQPELGVRYEFNPYNHCWPGPIQFGMETWITDVDAIDWDSLPSGIGDPDDRGWITQLSSTEAVYESRHGGTVTMTRAARPQQPSLCA